VSGPGPSRTQSTELQIKPIRSEHAGRLRELRADPEVARWDELLMEYVV
jgi:hypothetical protein